MPRVLDTKLRMLRTRIYDISFISPIRFALSLEAARIIGKTPSHGQRPEPRLKTQISAKEYQNRDG